MSIHSHLQYDQSTSHARVPAGGINLIASIDSASEAQVTASFFGSTKALHGEVAFPSAETTTHNHSNQQYSVTAVTTSAGSVAERYAYSAYGEPTICDASGSPLASSAINNRYSYTGREWDATVGLHHFRARWMSPKSGRFLSRDPIGYIDGDSLYASYMGLSLKDPTGLVCGTAIAKVKANKLYRKQGFTNWVGHKNWTIERNTSYDLGEQRLQLCADVIDCDCGSKGLGDPTVNGNGYTGYLNQPFYFWTVFRTEGEPSVSGGDCPNCITATQSSFWYVSDKEITVGGSVGDVGIEVGAPSVGYPFFGGTLTLTVTICADGTVTTSKNFVPTGVYQPYNRWWREYDYWINETVIWSMFSS